MRKNLKYLMQSIKLTDDYEAKVYHDTIIVSNIKNPNINCYIDYDEYTPGHPLEITDDGDLLAEISFPDSNTYWINPIMNAKTLSQTQADEINQITDNNQVGRLTLNNELVINTEERNLNADVQRFLRNLEMINRCLATLK